MKSFKQYLMKLVPPPTRAGHLAWGDRDVHFHKSRSSHLAWKDDDVHIHYPSKPDRTGHLAWRDGDLQIRKIVKEDYEDEVQSASPELAKEHNLSHDQLISHVKHHNSLRGTPRAMMRYYKDHSVPFNEELRMESHHVNGVEGHGDIIHHTDPEMINQLDKATSHPLEHDHTVYRSFDVHSIKLHKLNVGDTFTDHGYVGTTTKESTAKDYAHVYHEPKPQTPEEEAAGLESRGYDSHHHYTKIHVPAGSKGHFLDLQQGDWQNESELLLHRGTKFRVTGHEHQEEPAGDWTHHRHIMHLKVVGNEPKKVIKSGTFEDPRHKSSYNYETGEGVHPLDKMYHEPPGV